MIKPFTCLTVILAAGSGLYLYSEKHRTTLLDDRIRAVVADTHRIEDRTSMLRAEWALLNQPDRLQTLAAKFLPQLQPMAPTQFVQIADLDKHLPPEGPPREMYGPPAPPTLAPTTPPDARLVLASAVSRPAAPKPAVVRVAARTHRAPASHHTLYADASRPPVIQPIVRPVVAYAPAPIISGAWHPAEPFSGSALGMAHSALPPPMAAR